MLSLPTRVDLTHLVATHDFDAGGVFEAFRQYKIVRRRCSDPAALQEEAIEDGLSLTALDIDAVDDYTPHYGWVREGSRAPLERELAAGKSVKVRILPSPKGKAYLRRWKKWSSSLRIYQQFWEGRAQWESVE